MNGLQTVRVIVVDDDFSEVEPLLRGLSRLGIGALYFNGRELPTAPFSGIRLVFLDLHLSAASGGTHGAILETIGVLSQLIPNSKGEIGIICWTKHPDEVNDLNAKLKERWAAFEPAFVLGLSKADFLKPAEDPFARLTVKIEELFAATEKQLAPAASDGLMTRVLETLESTKGQLRKAVLDCAAVGTEYSQANVEALRASIEKILGDRRGSRLLWEWEQAVHNAASDTTSLVHDIANDRKEGETRDDALLTVLASLARAAGASAATTPAGAAASLFEGMNPIHADFLDQLASAAKTGAPHYQALLDAVQSVRSLSALQVAQTNAAILTAKLFEGSTHFQPGNLYIADAEKPDGCPHILCKIERFELGYGLLKTSKSEKWNKLASEIKDGPKKGYTPDQVEALRAEQQTEEDELLRKVLGECLCGVVEVSPACDFANKKFTPARFVGCLLVPESLEKAIRSGEFIRRVYPITLNARKGAWHLLLNSRFMFGVSNPTNQIKTMPLVRIRLPLLIDIQAWLAAQGARPGHIAIAQPD